MRKSTKHSEVAGELANLKGTVRIQDIIDAILRIENFKSKTLAGMISNAVYDPNEVGVVAIDEIWVDMTYQRIVRLKKLINKLQKMNGFDPYSAGVVDIAIRPSGKKFCWDGLRRIIMAGLCGLTHIKTSQLVHKQFMTDLECQKEEARYFKSRNADQESMKAEEIFKSEVVFGDPDAIELLNVFKNCELDVEGLNPDGTSMGGFVEVKNNYFRQKDGISEEYFIQSSRIIRTVYKDEPVVSGYLLTGLAHLLMKNEDVDTSYSEEEIIEHLQNYRRFNPKQSDLIKGRLAGNARASIAYLITRRALNDNNGLLSSIGLDEETMEVIDQAA
jgi:hypothetical protein